MIQQLKEILLSEGWLPSDNELTFTRDGEKVKICPRIVGQDQDGVAFILDEGGILIEFSDGLKEFLEFNALRCSILTKRFLTKPNSSVSQEKWTSLIGDMIHNMYKVDSQSLTKKCESDNSFMNPPRTYAIVESPDLKEYRVYHSTSEHRFTEVEEQRRVFVGTVKAENLEEAFRKSQNDLDTYWSNIGVRSTSVGDVLESDEGFYLVIGTGFKLLDVMSKNESEQNSIEE